MMGSLGFDLEGRRLPLQLAAAGVAVVGLLLGVAILLAGHVETFGMGGRSFVLGFLRVGYSFGVGVLIHRAGLHLRGPQMPRWLLAVILLIALLLPVQSGVGDAFIVLILMPALVWLGSRALADPLDRFWEWIGRLSYPVYLVHCPVLVAAYALLGGSVAAALAAMVLAIGVAWLALVLFDEPLRGWIGNRARRKRGAAHLVRQDP